MCLIRLLLKQKLEMAKRNKNKGSKKTEEVPPESQQRDETKTEPNHENGLEAQQMRKAAIQGVYTPKELYEQHQFSVEPYKDQDDIIAFLLNWMMTFMYTFFFMFVIIALSVHGFLSYNYDGTLWLGALYLSLIFLFITASAILPLWVELSELLEYIFKCAGIINFFVILAFTVIVFLRSYWVDIEFDETFWKIATWISILWLVSAISTVTAWYTIHNRHQLKKRLFDFMLFVIRYAIALAFLLALVTFSILVSGNNLLGIEFDDTFWKVVGCLCYILMISFISAFIALINESFRWKKYSIRFRDWRKFLVIVFKADT